MILYLNSLTIKMILNQINKIQKKLIYPSKSCLPIDEVELVSNNTKLSHKKLKNRFCFSINKKNETKTI